MCDRPILVVEPSTIERWRLVRMLKRHEYDNVRGVADEEEMLAAVFEQEPYFILISLELDNALWEIQRLKQGFPEIQVIALGSRGHLPDWKKLLTLTQGVVARRLGAARSQESILQYLQRWMPYAQHLRDVRNQFTNLAH